ncbi:MAG: hypothetical protein GF388_09035 [Candidatus Aegiribacteria sp.]|nr:hypothetical protein [Candidatus Aegiribacteria sp.]MBD3295205.1 hypothetical protein [Candidatus Fermentibacteria bacterium]
MGTPAGIINGIFDLILIPFGGLPPIWGLLFVSLLSGLGMIAVFKAVSDQDRISRIRRRMAGEIMGILLHVSSPGTVLRFAGRLIWSNTVYLGYMLKPLLVIAVPFMLVWGQLEARYGALPMQQNEKVTVTVQYPREQYPQREDLDITANGLEVVPPAVMVDTLQQVSFRVVPEGNTDREICFSAGCLPVGRVSVRSGARILRGFETGGNLWSLFTPHIEIVDREPMMPRSGWYSLKGTDYNVLGWHWSWIAVFLVFSMISALAGAKVMKVKV